MRKARPVTIVVGAAIAFWLSGRLVATSTPTDQPPQPLIGMADIHNHQFSNLGFGGLAVVGSAWDYAEGLALNPGIDSWIHTPLHGADVLAIFDGPKPCPPPLFKPYFNGGFPDYEGWPTWCSIDHQQVYYEWLKQAYTDGLRLMSVLAVSNEVLCNQLQTMRNLRLYPDCNDMSAIARQVDAAFALQDFIDRQSGGPGKGWYRIARSAKEARDIIGSNKLAVVLGVEVSNLFECNRGLCTEADVDHGVAKLYDMGVRQVFVVHEFDNDFAGPAMFLNSLNLGNYWARKEYFQPEECSQYGYSYKFDPDVVDFLMRVFTGAGGTPTVSHNKADCNSRGLTTLGKYLVKRLMDKRMIVDVDHMSHRATDDTLEIAERRHYRYPVISSHTTFLGVALKTPSDNQQSEFHKTDKQLERIRALHGLIAPILQTYKHEQTDYRVTRLPYGCDYCSEEWAQRYLYALDKGPWPGIPIGSDFNGVIHHVAPRPKSATPRDAEVYRGADSATRPAGSKVWAYSTDGLAHIGLMAGFIQDLNEIGLTATDLAPLGKGAEAYVQMWERIDAAPAANP